MLAFFAIAADNGGLFLMTLSNFEKPHFTSLKANKCETTIR
jgi:hypothetical protein